MRHGAALREIATLRADMNGPPSTDHNDAFKLDAPRRGRGTQRLSRSVQMFTYSYPPISSFIKKLAERPPNATHSSSSIRPTSLRSRPSFIRTAPLGYRSSITARWRHNRRRSALARAISRWTPQPLILSTPPVVVVWRAPLLPPRLRGAPASLAPI